MSGVNYLYLKMVLIKPALYLWTRGNCQALCDKFFENNSQAMGSIIMNLTNGTSTEGLNYIKWLNNADLGETVGGNEIVRNVNLSGWWQPGGVEAHNLNYPYFYNEALRDSEVGRRIIDSMIDNAFLKEDLELEREIMEVLTKATGLTIGSYVYKEGDIIVSEYDSNDSSIVPHSVNGER